MKRLIVSLAISFIVMFMASSNAAAQMLNCFSFSTSIAEYDDLTSDGTNLTSWVVVDGSQEMTAWGQCLQFYGYAVHTPYAFNQLKTPEQTVGGWTAGTGVCSNCYIFVANEQTITPQLGEDVQFGIEGFATCNFGGDYFDTGILGRLFHLSENFSHFSYEFVTDEDHYCGYTLECTVGNSTCGPTHEVIGKNEWCPLYLRTRWLSEDVFGVRICAGKNYPATEGGPCS